MSRLLEKYENDPESLELIIQFLRGRSNVALPAKLKEILDRLNYAYDQLVATRDEDEVSAYLVAKYGYTEYQAKNDLMDAKRIHNYITPELKNFEYGFLIKQGWMLYNKALEEKDLRTAKDIWKEMLKENAELRKEGEKPPVEPPVMLIISSDPSLLGKKSLPSESELLRKIKEWNTSKQGESFIQDVDFQELNNDSKAN